MRNNDLENAMVMGGDYYKTRKVYCHCARCNRRIYEGQDFMIRDGEAICMDCEMDIRELEELDEIDGMEIE